MSTGDAGRGREVSGRLGELLGEPLAGEALRLSAGASRETFSFRLGSGRELVAQIERHAGSSGQLSQAALLQAAERAGAPVPRVVAHGADDPVLGASWTLVEALPGTTDPAAILAGEGVPAAPQLLDSIAAALAAVHRIEPDRELAPFVADPVAAIRGLYDGLGEPHATFEVAFRALRDRPPPARPSLVHGDFRMGNLMIGTEGVTGVLDWELTHLGDPAEDLGWLCVPAWRFTRPDLPAAGLGTREELLAAYERHSGDRVDLDTLRWWELTGTLRWGVICVMQAFRHLSGQVQSVEHAVIGRRACEVEWDLLEMLDPSAADSGGELELPGPPFASPRPLHDRPDMVELIDAVRGALGDDVLPQLEGRPAFQLRVSMRALGMVRRELMLAGQHAALAEATFAALGVADEAELAKAVREGAYDGREAELIAGLRALVRAKLEVANPRYLGASGDSPGKGSHDR